MDMGNLLIRKQYPPSIAVRRPVNADHSQTGQKSMTRCPEPWRSQTVDTRIETTSQYPSPPRYLASFSFSTNSNSPTTAHEPPDAIILVAIASRPDGLHLGTRISGFSRVLGGESRPQVHCRGPVYTRPPPPPTPHPASTSA